MIYGLVAIIMGFIKIEKEVPGGVDSHGYPKTKKVYEAVKLPLRYPAFIVGLILAIVLSLITRIDGQNVGVVTTPNGVRNEPLHTGWHVVAPWNSIHMMDKTVWVYTCANSAKEGQKPNADAIWTPTKDGIKLGFDVSVSWRIVAESAPWIYQNVTENDGGNSGRYLWLEENVIRPKLKSALALTVSNYTPIEAYSTKRQDIQNDILKRIGDECKQYRLHIDNVDVREVFYNADYEKSINAKKLAEQEVLRLVEVTKQQEELKKQEAIKKDIAILTAEGESRALQIKGQAISNNPKIIELEWITKWDGSLPTYMMGSGQGVMLNLNNK